MVLYSQYFTGRPWSPSEQAAQVVYSRAAAARQERALARRPAERQRVRVGLQPQCDLSELEEGQTAPTLLPQVTLPLMGVADNDMRPSKDTLEEDVTLSDGAPLKQWAPFQEEEPFQEMAHIEEETPVQAEVRLENFNYFEEKTLSKKSFPSRKSLPWRKKQH